MIDGAILIKRNSCLESSVVTDGDAGAITLGNGDGDHDPRIIIYSSTSLKLLSGTLNIKTVNQSSFLFSNIGSELAIASDARLNLYNSILLDPGVLTLQNNCSFGVSNSTGATFTGGINIPGDYTYIDM